ncbi:MAG: pre-toxin TG domain-containing protein, partial [Lachnospiraceae bacterium]|nr:pre-toxin TG domain-containing protein [Lachnospiraceae bacterium]
VPVVGDIKDVQEAVTGVDLVTGERLSKVERGISLACMLIPIVNGKMVIKGGKKLLRIGSEIPGAVIKVGNVVTKNTAKYKVYLRKIWIDEKININKYIGEAKDTVRKIKNGELYSYEYITPDGQRIKVRDLDDVPKNETVYGKVISESGGKTADINNPILDNIRTGSALKDDSLHAFNDIIDNYASDATKFLLIGGDGVERILYQIEGSLNGKQGIFEWIVDPNPAKGITHRRFIEGVGITGKPNARP